MLYKQRFLQSVLLGLEPLSLELEDDSASAATWKKKNDLKDSSKDRWGGPARLLALASTRGTARARKF